MVIGPDNYYKCPKCGVVLKNRSLLSGNTCGAVFYSDGKRDAIMLPDLPNLTKCPSCGAIFWLSDLRELDDDKLPDSDAREDTPYAEHLGLKDLYRALDENTSVKDETEKKQREIQIRRRIWWNYNRKPDINENEKTAWRENCLALLELLDINNNDQRCTAAELYRNLGDFSKSLELARPLSKKYNTFRLRTMEACCLANTQTFILDDENLPGEELYYDIVQNSDNELLFVIGEYEGEPENPRIVYNGGEAAVLYRNKTSSVILDVIHPNARDLLKNAGEVLVAECVRVDGKASHNNLKSGLVRDYSVKKTSHGGTEAQSTQKRNNNYELWNQTNPDGSIETLKTLLEQGADPNLIYKDGDVEWTPLLNCFRPFPDEGVNDLDSGTYIPPLNKEGWLPFNILGTEQIEKAKILLEHGADPNLTSPNLQDFPPLMMAIFYGFSKKFDIDADDEAVGKAMLELVEMMLKRGANPDFEDKDGATPLSLALNSELPEVVELLKKYGATKQGEVQT